MAGTPNGIAGGWGTVGQGFAGCLGPGWSAALTAQAAGFHSADINNPIFNATHQLVTRHNSWWDNVKIIQHLIYLCGKIYLS